MAQQNAWTFHCTHTSGESMSVTLVLGGARSGKSRYAEGLCATPRIYVATAQAFDDEMASRIVQHQERRGAAWVTIDAPLDLPGALKAYDKAGCALLVDCLTLWLTNLVMAEKDCEAEVSALVAWLASARGNVVFVSNELGLGLVPESGLGRRFRDLHGLMNQRVAAFADTVVFVVAGLPLVLKGRLPNLR
jgi:adenosylcobinamide kinase / adenosylcobinamide-phosphate guanylyltransferase